MKDRLQRKLQLLTILTRLNFGQLGIQLTSRGSLKFCKLVTFNTGAYEAAIVQTRLGRWLRWGIAARHPGNGLGIMFGTAFLR